MIRPMTPADTDAVIAFADATGLFLPNELAELSGMMADYVSGHTSSDHVWIIDDDGGPVGVAYYAPEPFTEQVWNLYLIAVRPDRQRARTRCDLTALR